MKNAKITLVAEWSGWCGSCAAERPLVVTRTGRRSLRAWLSATSAPDELLTLGCRLCGVGAVVPDEADDPEVLVVEDPPGALAHDLPAGRAPTPLPPPECSVTRTPATASGAPSGGPDAPARPVPVGADVHAARRAVGAGLAALLAQRTAAAHQHPTVPLAPAPAQAPLVRIAPLPTQRASSESLGLDGIQALQLLAEGIDLLTPARP